MTNGFLEEYYALERAYNGRVEDIPDERLEALRARYPDESSEASVEPNIHVEKKLSKRMIQIQKLWDRGFTVEEMAKETKLATISIRGYLTKLKLPANSIYHYQITRGDEIYFARSIRELAIKLNINYKGSRTNIRKKAREQGWKLCYGDWREYEVKRESK